MKKILVVIDMQNDFIDGVLGTAQAVAIVPNVVAKINSYASLCAEGVATVYATRDTHEENYLETQEGKFLPVKHCVRGTHGWQINPQIEDALKNAGAKILDKPTFGSRSLAELLAVESKIEPCEIEFVGLYTDICVVSNVLMTKNMSPEMPILLDASCCAGVTSEKHEAALETMRSCQVRVH